MPEPDALEPARPSAEMRNPAPVPNAEVSEVDDYKRSIVQSVDDRELS